MSAPRVSLASESECESGSRVGVALVLFLVLTGACQKDRDRGSDNAGAVRPQPSAAAIAAVSPEAGLAPRCSLVGGGATGDVVFGEGTELGEVVAFEGGLAIGALRAAEGKQATEGGRVASVLRLSGSAASALDLGPLSKDAPAPQLLVRGDELFAVSYLRRSAGPTSAAGPRRALSVHRVAATTERLVELPPETDVSSSFDGVAAPSGSPIGAVVVWDDDSGTPPHSLLEVATLAPDLRAVRGVRAWRAAADPATDAGDAGDPRLAVREGGYWLTWLARRPEHAASALPLPAGEVETPSEEATYGWIEAVPLDALGVPAGASKRLTSATGHVANYAMASEPLVGALLVVVVDEALGRAGGSLDQVVWHGRADETPDLTHLVRSGVEEETPPALVMGASGGLGDGWLAFLDVRSDTQMLPLTLAATAPRASPTKEPLLQGGRLLGPLPVAWGAASHMALATTDGARWTLRSATCVR